MKYYIITISLIFTLVLSTINTYSQTQEEIEQMQNGSDEKKEKTNLKKELKKREKEIDSKKEEKVSKKEKTKKEEEIIPDKFSKLNYRKTKKIGDKLSSKGSFYNALEYYNNALLKTKKDKKKIYLYNKLANANFVLRDYKRADNYYTKALKLNTKTSKYPYLEYQLATTYKYLGKYDTSIAMFNRFIRNQTDNDNVSNALRKAIIEIKGCKYAIDYINNEPKYKVDNAGENVNGPFSDYGPEIVGDRLYFSKINSEKVIVLDGEVKEKEFSKIYYSDNHSDKFNVFQDFARSINTKNIHVGNPSFSKDGNTVYFTKCILTGEMQSQCKIYSSQKADNSWGDAVLLNKDVNLEKTNNTQPQIADLGEGKQILYFVSNRPGRGGKDIWFTTIEDGIFSKVKNAGKMNTSYDDISPFYSNSTKTLYFSSNGRVGFGGFDVYKISKDGDKWGEEIENLGLPINSSLDDYDFVMDSKESNGFLTSNRVGTTTLKSETCCDDIFKISQTKVDIYVMGNLYIENATARSIVPVADMYLLEEGTENSQIIDYKDGKSFLIKVEKDKKYKIKVFNDAYDDFEMTFTTEGIVASDTFQFDMFLKNKKIIEDRVLTIIYYEFDSARLKEGSIDSLEKVVRFMTAYPDIIVEVGSHTDSKGSEEYNIELSERRSLSVKNYLIYQKKIAEERLIHKSYGEGSPSFINTNDDGTDNKEGRDLNRRTEFKVVGHLKDKKK